MTALHHWQLFEAKNKLTQVINLSKKEGPQVITVRGHEEAVIMSMADYEKLFFKKDLLSFFKSSPLKGEDLSLQREQDFGRSEDLF